MARPKKVAETPVEETKRARSANRSKEERIAELQKKIEHHEKCIENLKTQISDIENGTTGTIKKDDLLDLLAKMAAKEGKTVSELMAENK